MQTTGACLGRRIESVYWYKQLPCFPAFVGKFDVKLPHAASAIKRDILLLRSIFLILKLSGMTDCGFRQPFALRPYVESPLFSEKLFDGICSVSLLLSFFDDFLSVFWRRLCSAYEVLSGDGLEPFGFSIS